MSGGLTVVAIIFMVLRDPRKSDKATAGGDSGARQARRQVSSIHHNVVQRVCTFGRAHIAASINPRERVTISIISESQLYGGKPAYHSLAAIYFNK